MVRHELPFFVVSEEKKENYHKEVFVLYVFVRYTNSKDVSFYRKGCRNGRRDVAIWQEHWE